MSESVYLNIMQTSLIAIVILILVIKFSPNYPPRSHMKALVVGLVMAMATWMISALMLIWSN